MNKLRLLVFTDLDGTLLDHNTYSVEPARDALNLLARRNIPVIFNTSKTRAEALHLRALLNNNAPFATENGSCVSVPDNYFNERSPTQATVHTTIFGSLYNQIRQVLCHLRAEYGFDFTGFGDMSAEQVSACTGLGSEDAQRARERDCSEPLLWHDSKEKMALFTRLLLSRNLHITRGGRFYHVATAGDKGLAVRWLTDHFRAECPGTPFKTIGLGDGINDLPMLENVDFPILIRAEHKNAPAGDHIRNLTISSAPGPTGWNQEITRLVQALI